MQPAQFVIVSCTPGSYPEFLSWILRVVSKSNLKIRDHWWFQYSCWCQQWQPQYGFDLISRFNWLKNRIYLPAPVKTLQLVQNTVAPILTRTTVLAFLLWLPVKFRIEYESLSSHTESSLRGSSPGSCALSGPVLLVGTPVANWSLCSHIHLAADAGIMRDIYQGAKQEYPILSTDLLHVYTPKTGTFSLAWPRALHGGWRTPQRSPLWRAHFREKTNRVATAMLQGHMQMQHGKPQ